MNEGVSPPTITIEINGKTAQANLPSGGGGKWVKLDRDSAVYNSGDVLIVIINTMFSFAGNFAINEVWHILVLIVLRNEVQQAISVSISTGTSALAVTSGEFAGVSVWNSKGSIITLNGMVVSNTSYSSDTLTLGYKHRFVEAIYRFESD